MCHRLHVPTHGEDFPALRAYPATDTSSEAESEPDGLPGGHTPSGVGDHATRYATTGLIRPAQRREHRQLPA
ncbi:hypothetical protein OG244_38545 [Streptomyces brevispora]|uniref:hypothetical protein n=1 Tax=Streptomyces brevispora TaxID=887462 RepID=UPI002E332CC3|nr:hypothetical protein [Streptomyces brevispora]